MKLLLNKFINTHWQCDIA